MKLKYYLRGLGIGVFISTIILSISFSAKNKTLTNVEIMNRAEELGMVKEEDIETAVSEKLEKIRQEEESSAEEEPIEEVVEEEFIEEEVAEETSKEEEVAEELPEEFSEELPEESNVVESVTITVSSGMWSEDVSKLLENNGVVDSASSFNTYLIENGYQHRIRTGEYTLLKGTSFEEIAKTITNR